MRMALLKINRKMLSNTNYYIHRSEEIKSPGSISSGVMDFSADLCELPMILLESLNYADIKYHLHNFVNRYIWIISIERDTFVGFFDFSIHYIFFNYSLCPSDCLNN